MSKTEPKIVLFDLETLPDLREVMKVMPQLSAYPGLTLKASINSVICFGYKTFGEDTKAKCLNAWDFKSWGRDVNDDKEIVTRAREILVNADCVVTHNGKRFDWKFLQTRLMKHDLDPLPRILHVDTCAASKSNLMLFNNRLNTLAKFMTSEEKMENGGWDLWVDVQNRDKKAMKIMTDYCKQDVEVLEKVFKRLRPFIQNIPNYNMQRVGEAVVCPNCGSTRLEKHGTRATKHRLMQRLRCKDCGTTSAVTSEGKDPKTY